MKYENDEIIKSVKNLIKKMTLSEKIGQLYQSPFFSDIVTGHSFDSSQTTNRIRSGSVGSVLSVHDESVIKELQRIAVKETRLGIPLIFAFDVIHGYKTAFPINLALSNSWDASLIEKVSNVVAYETAHKGIHLTFSPMLDIVRDPRWGRVMESNGEDPYLSSVLAKAYIQGYQQNNLADPNSVAACAKHFIGYGKVEAGREYNTVDISKRVLYNTYLPPFISAIKSNVSMVMTAFNTVFDRPATANKELLKGILREKLKFDGVIISDYSSTEELISHKVAKDRKDVALQCFDAGLEHEMVSDTYIEFLKELVEEGKITEADIDVAVSRILKLKYELGLFDNPYRNLYENSQQYMLKDDSRALSRIAAENSIVLLKNDNILPLKYDTKIVLCGPYIDSNDLIGSWAALTNRKDVVTIKQAFDNHHQPYDLDTNEKSIKNAEAIIMAIGEPGYEAGEGKSKTKIYLDDSQKLYFDSIYKLNKNIIIIVFAGRPLIMTYYDQYSKAILYAFQPGLEAGNALYRLIYGKVSPNAKITMSFPYHEGQIPIYYNHYKTGRPYDKKRPDYRYNTGYLDCKNSPLYPFGYGLSYGSFVYKNLSINKQILKKHDKLDIKVEILNESQFETDEIIQCYIEALSFSVARPVNELKAFKKINFKPKEHKIVEFELNIDDFRSYNIDMNWTAESTIYKVKVGPNSSELIEKRVQVIDE